MNVYEVGGAVRDELLGQPVTERDWVVVGATPQDLLDLGYRPVGKDFPVFLHPDTAEEYALARTERKTAPGYRGFAVDSAPGVTLEQDLMRRDLTINSIARGPDGGIVDPFDGRGDLERRMLRHVSPAFAEDPVRILRCARFAARFAGLGFRVAPETLALMRSMVDAGEADALVPERVWKETLRALQTQRPAVFLQVLRDCGALAVIFPEIDRLFGVPQPPRWHPEIDTGVHTLMVVDAAAALSDDARVRFAAMTHDLGKGVTPIEQLPSHRGHEAGSVRLVEALCKRLRIPNDYRDLAVAVARYHGHSHRLQELKATTILGTLEGLDAFRRPERFDGFLLACEADARGRGGLEREPYPQAALFRRCRDAAAAAVLDAPDLQGLAGAEIGERLRARRLTAVKMALRGPALS